MMVITVFKPLGRRENPRVCTAKRASVRPRPGATCFKVFRRVAMYDSRGKTMPG